MNNCPLTYIEDDIQYPVLTPNRIILVRETKVLEENPEDEGESDSKKQQRYIKRCKDLACRKWQKEYLTSLGEKYDMKYKSNRKTIRVGNIAKIGRIDEALVVQDGVIKNVQIKATKGFLEQLVQLLHPLELHWYNITDDGNKTELEIAKKGNTHYVKSVRIRSYTGPHFPAFGLNTERYSVSLRI